MLPRQGRRALSDGIVEEFFDALRLVQTVISGVSKQVPLTSFEGVYQHRGAADVEYGVGTGDFVRQYPAGLPPLPW